jgi:tripartite-type tricarboxylate transporter receptor subunit TctC
MAQVRKPAIWPAWFTLLGALLLAATTPALSADSTYPTRSIRLLIGFPPGAAMDGVARPLAARLSQLLGQPVIVENKSGAGGTLSSAAVAHAPADGYTLGIGANGDLVIAPQLIKVDYDPRGSFTPISLVSREEGFVLLAHPSFPADSVKELVDLARAQPGTIHYGSPGVGVPHHIGMEWFKKAAQINIVHVPFKGGGPMVSDLLGGQILLGIGNVTAAPLITAGKMKAIAVTASRRIPALPQVATFAESGYPSVDIGGWFALIGPAGLPPAVIRTLNAAAREATQDSALNERLFSYGMSANPTTSEELARLIRDDFAKWGKLIRDTGVTVE